MLTAGTKALDGWNLKIPLIGAGIVMLAGLVAKIIKLVQTLASGGIFAALSGGGFGAAVAGISLIVTAIVGLASSASKANKSVEDLKASMEAEGSRANTFEA